MLAFNLDVYKGWRTNYKGSTHLHFLPPLRGLNPDVKRFLLVA